MSKRLSDDVIRWTLDVNGKPAMKELGGLEQETRALEKTNKDLNMELRKMEAAGKKNSQVYQGLKKQINENNTAITNNKNRMAALRKEIGLTGLTARQLRSEAQKLKNQLDNTTPNTAEWRKLDNQLKAVQGQMAKTRGGMQQTNGLFGQMKGAIAGIGLLYMGRQLLQVGKELFNLNLQMELWEKRAKIVFGQSFPMVTREAEKNAKALGLTAREYVNAASATADLLVPLNFTREASAKMSVDLVNLAGALDEWTAGQYGAEEVSAILTKTLLGEAEQIKKLGIVVDQSSKGYNDRVKILMQEQNLTREQARALEIYSQVMEKSVDAQTAFNDSSANLLRQQKSYKLFWKELKESAAVYLDEVATGLMYIGDNMARDNNNLKRTLNKLLGTTFEVKPLTEYAAAILHTDKNFVKLYKTVKTLGIESEEGAAAFAALEKELYSVYGKEGLDIALMVYQEQYKAKLARARQANAEEISIQQKQNEILLEAEKEAQKKAKDAALKMLDDLNKEKKIALMQQRADNLIDEEQYQAEIKTLDYAAMHARLEIMKKYGEDLKDIKLEILAAELAMINELIKAQKELEDKRAAETEARIANWQSESEAEIERNIEHAANLYDIQKEGKQKEIDLWRTSASAIKDTAENAFETVGEAFGEFLINMEGGQRKFGKTMLNLMLDILHKIVKIEIAKVWARALASPESVASGGVLGVIKATGLTLLIETAFGAAKAAINAGQAARGRYNVIGQDDGRMYRNVNHTGTVRRSGIVNQGQKTLINEQGGEMILTAPHTRNLMMNYPALMNALMATRVPQRAVGNYQAAAGVATQPATDEETRQALNDVSSAVAMLVQRLNQPIEADISYTKLNKSQTTVNNTRGRVQRR